MGKVTGFIEYQRSLPILREPKKRVANWDEFHAPLPGDALQTQGARCMNCGIPFCHVGQTDNGLTKGCPLHNLIPEWNDLVYHGRWFEAYKRLSLTNNFPEFTGRVCPAPCESSCVLGINEDPVMIKEIEVAIIDRAFEEGWLAPNPPKQRTGKRVAVVGSGPAGLACADELNKAGHGVTVFERADRIGGLLMYGIPNMKLDKGLVDRRVNLLAEEGVEFRAGVNVGIDLTAEDLKQNFDAVVLTTGAPQPRDLPVEGRTLGGVHYAMDFLTANTKSLLDSRFSDGKYIDVKDKKVIVIGGGDTGTDCIASSLRLGCQSVTQFEIMPQMPERIATHDNWLGSVRTFQVDYGQEEAITLFGSDPRRYNTLTRRFIGDEKGNLVGLETVEVEWTRENGKNALREVAGTEKLWEADVVFLAMGFVGAEKAKFLEDLGVEYTDHKTIAVNKAKQTSVPNVFAAGDCERGQSLVVWAIADGRDAAKGVNDYLKGN
ncbi:MAG: glutamate synthase [Acidobacteria bacterium]|nr:glutamate synthase [Acidobacteriota bacterium]